MIAVPTWWMRRTQALAWRMMPEKKYRLRDGRLGTEWEEALTEALRTLEAKRVALEEEIELMQIRLRTAEGRPPDA